jgi:hypothetical protein
LTFLEEESFDCEISKYRWVEGTTLRLRMPEGFEFEIPDRVKETVQAEIKARYPDYAVFGEGTGLDPMVVKKGTI